jgi:hypothetical protein
MFNLGTHTTLVQKSNPTILGLGGVGPMFEMLYSKMLGFSPECTQAKHALDGYFSLCTNFLQK